MKINSDNNYKNKGKICEAVRTEILILYWHGNYKKRK